MIRIAFTTDLQLQRDPGATDEEVRAELDRVMGELLVIEGAGVSISDAALSVDLSTDVVTVELLATGPDFDLAHATALSSLRSAIHAAGGRTPGWEWIVLDRRSRAELVDA